VSELSVHATTSNPAVGLVEAANVSPARRLDPLDDPQWDDKISRFPEATIFHTTAWLRVIKSTYGFSPIAFAVPGGGGFTSVLPMMEVDSWLTGRRGISLPFTDHCGALSAQANAEAPWQRAVEYAGERRWKYVECRGRAPCREAKPASSYLGHTIDLSATPDRLFGGLESSARRSIRKAEGVGLTVEFSQAIESMREFYVLMRLTRQRHGLPPQPYRFFSNIHRHIVEPGQGVIVLVRKGAAAVAGGVFFHFGRHALYKFGASDARFQHFRPNNLMMWSALKWHCSKGFAHLDLGRTAPANAGLRRFKLGWGAQERAIDYFRYDCRNRQFMRWEPEAPGWETRAFRAMPLWISRMIGQFAYRHVA
jgi:hypothetical protein